MYNFDILYRLSCKRQKNIYSFFLCKLSTKN